MASLRSREGGGERTGLVFNSNARAAVSISGKKEEKKRRANEDSNQHATVRERKKRKRRAHVIGDDVFVLYGKKRGGERRGGLLGNHRGKKRRRDSFCPKAYIELYVGKKGKRARLLAYLVAGRRGRKEQLFRRPSDIILN